MSTTMTMEPLEIEVAEEIRNQSQLNGDVEKANRYLQELLLDNAGLQADKRSIIWRLSNIKDHVAVLFSEQDYRYGPRDTTHIVRIADMHDDIARDVAMIRLLQKVARTRSEQIGTKMDQYIRELEEQHGDGK